jgi:hypothetical protein
MARIQVAPLKNRNTIPDKGIDTSPLHGAQTGSGAHSNFCPLDTKVSFLKGKTAWASLFWVITLEILRG